MPNSNVTNFNLILRAPFVLRVYRTKTTFFDRSKIDVA